MNLKESVQITLPREVVFQALNDPDILQQSIPGCEKIDKVDERHLEALIAVKFGPMKVRFNSKVEIDPTLGPEKFTLNGDGDAGAAGLAKGQADVHLEENADGTMLNYDVNIDISGKLAQVGARLMEGTSKRIAKKFFTNFEQVLADRQS